MTCSRGFRRILTLTVVALLVVFAAPAAARDVRAAQDAPSAPTAAPPSVTVTGQGRAAVPPDAATFTVGVELTGTSLSDLLARAGDQMNAAIAALEAAGVAPEDIQTAAFRVEVLPREEPPRPVAEPVAEVAPAVASPAAEGEPQRFRVVNLVQVRARDLSLLGEQIDTALAAGANTVFGVNFTVADPSALASLARAEAYRNARQAAEDLAAAAGLDLGQVLAINEESVPPVAPVALEEAAVDAAVPIRAGTIEVAVTVRVTYELVAGNGPAEPPATPTT